MLNANDIAHCLANAQYVEAGEPIARLRALGRENAADELREDALRVAREDGTTGDDLSTLDELLDMGIRKATERAS